MASLAEIIRKEQTLASRKEAQELDIRKQIAAAEVWDGAKELSDFDLAIKLSQQSFSSPSLSQEDDEGKSYNSRMTRQRRTRYPVTCR
jgi:hypothetical protein